MTAIALVLALLVAPAAPDTVPDAGPDPAPADTVALPADAYLDATARALVERARARHDGLERAIEAYETTAREWVDVRARVMGRERLIHREEMVARIHWRRGEPAEVELLGGRSVTPVSDPEVEADRSGANLAFDPADIQRVLRLPGLGASADDEGGRFIIHPLAPASERHYRFRYAGETQVRLADGRVVRLLELQAIPRRSDPRLVRGSLWLESETYGIVRTVFRLARPLEVNLDLDLPRAATRTLGLGGGARGDLRVLAMEAALWEGRWWLPRWITMEGVGEIGALTFPIRWERSYDGFRVEGPDLPLAAEARPLFGEDSARGRCPPREERPEGTTCNCGPLGCVVARVTAPESDSLLIHSPELPPSIFRGGDGVLSAGERAELEAWARRAAAVPVSGFHPRLRLPYRDPGLLRYNRVEGLSVGARVEVETGPLAAELEGRIGTADLVPNAALRLRGEAGPTRWRAGVAHELALMDADAGGLGAGASLSALLLGRDDAEYYRRTGASLTLLPRSPRAVPYELRLTAERQRPVEKGTDISLPGLLGDRELGPVAAADPADQLGAGLRLQRTLGEDPTRPRLHGSTRLEGWAGTFDYGRAAADVQLAVPLGGGAVAAVEVAGGSALGEVPVQGLWRLGGARTLRGHPGSALAGQRYWRARGEVGRGMQAVRLVTFGDVGWAGDAGSGEVTVRPLWAAGVGGSVLDGLLRLDVARGFGETGGWRAYLYLDGAI
jgi:hypothetical protein